MIIIVLLIGLFVRAYPRYKLRDVYSSDTYYHLFCALSIKLNKFKIPNKLPRVHLSHRYTYPYFYHLILSCFGHKSRLWVERNTGAIFDTLSNLCVYTFVVVNTETASFWEARWSLPLALSSLIAVSPAHLRLGSGPRAYNGSPRTLGQFLYVVHVLTAYCGYTSYSKLWLFVSVMAGGLAVITAKFTLQVLIFFGIFFSIFISPYYAVLLLVSFLFSILLSQGRSLRIIEGHLRHSELYYNYFQKPFLYPHIRTLKQYKESVLNVWKYYNIKDKFDWVLIAERYPLHLFLTVFPQFILVPGLIIRFDDLMPLGKFMTIWAVSGLICFIITKHRRFLFLGEGERYLEYALYPSLYILLVVSGRWYLHVAILLMLLSSIFAWWYINTYIKQNYLAHNSYGTSSAYFEQLDKMPAGVIWPIGSFHFQTLYRSKSHRVISHAGNMDRSAMEDIDLMYANYPYPSGDFERILDKYNVTYIVSDEAHTRHYKNNFMANGDQFDALTELLFDSGVLKIWKIK